MPIQEAVTSWMNCICVSKELKNIYIYAYMQHCEIYVRGLASDRRRLRVIEVRSSCISATIYFVLFPVVFFVGGDFINFILLRISAFLDPVGVGYVESTIISRPGR